MTAAGPGVGLPEDYVVLTPARMRARYVTLTDRLIMRLEGSDGPRPDEVLFLDKSGRPVAWLVKALWPLLARVPGTRYADDRVPPMPGLRFANIDREQWWHVTGGTETGLVDVGLVPEEAVDALRTVFVARRPRTGEPVSQVPAWLDGKRILVVDEVSNSGDTLRIATGLVQRAFPSANVEGTHWMTPGPVTDRHGFTRVKDVPVWYRSDTWTGRLVGNRFDPGNPYSTWRSRGGALFQSTRPRVPDEQGRRLRAEAAWLAADVAAGRLLAAPSPLRDEGDWDDRVRHLYGYTDARAFTAARDAASGRP